MVGRWYYDSGYCYLKRRRGGERCVEWEGCMYWRLGWLAGLEVCVRVDRGEKESVYG